MSRRQRNTQSPDKGTDQIHAADKGTASYTFGIREDTQREIISGNCEKLFPATTRNYFRQLPGQQKYFYLHTYQYPATPLQRN